MHDIIYIYIKKQTAKFEHIPHTPFSSPSIASFEQVNHCFGSLNNCHLFKYRNEFYINFSTLWNTWPNLK